MVYRPPRALGLLVGSLLALWAASIAILLLSFGVRSEIGLAGFAAYAGAAGAGALAVLFAGWTVALWTLTYALDRNALVVTWGLTQQVVPLAAIERLVPGSDAGAAPVRGVTWWGCRVGRAESALFGPVLSYSTAHDHDDALYVVTAERAYALTVEDPEEFARQVLVRQQLGPTAEVEHHARHAELGVFSIFGDRAALALAALAAAGGAGVWLQIALRYASLPETFQAHFPPGAEPPLGAITGPATILEAPQAAAALLVAGLVAGVALHRWERVASRLVLGAAAATQALFIAAVAVAIG